MSKDNSQKQEGLDHSKIIKAVQSGDLDATRELLDQISNDQIPQIKGKDGQTLLHLATATGKVEIVELLLDKAPALVDVRDIKGNYALNYTNGNNDIEKVLTVGTIQHRIELGNEVITNTNDKAIIVIGRTGAGKSTLVNYLTNPESLEVVLLKDEENPFDEGELVIGLKNQYKDNALKIGHTKDSKTAIPDKWSNNHTTYWDCPGFEDTNGPLQEIPNAFYLKKIFDSAKEVKLILAIDYNDLKNSRAKDIKKLTDTLGDLLCTDSLIDVIKGLSLVVTKVDAGVSLMSIKGEIIKMLKANCFREYSVGKEVLASLILPQGNQKALDLISNLFQANPEVKPRLEKLLIHNDKIAIFKKAASEGDLLQLVDGNLLCENTPILNIITRSDWINQPKVNISISADSKLYVKTLADQAISKIAEAIKIKKLDSKPDAESEEKKISLEIIDNLIKELYLAKTTAKKIDDSSDISIPQIEQNLEILVGCISVIKDIEEIISAALLNYDIGTDSTKQKIISNLKCLEFFKQLDPTNINKYHDIIRVYFNESKNILDKIFIKTAEQIVVKLKEGEETVTNGLVTNVELSFKTLFNTDTDTLFQSCKKYLKLDDLLEATKKNILTPSTTLKSILDTVQTPDPETDPEGVHIVKIDPEIINQIDPYHSISCLDKTYADEYVQKVQKRLNNEAFKNVSESYNAQVGLVISRCCDSEQTEKNSRYYLEKGDTVLHWAASKGLLEVCQVILKAKLADVNNANKYSRTALNYAAGNGHKEICELLIPKMSQEAIDSGIGEVFVQAATSRLTDVCKLLIPKMSPEAINTIQHGATLLHAAARYGLADVCKLLISKMSEEAINIVQDGGTVLHAAAKSGLRDVCKLLIPKMSSGAINAINTEGKTALHYAAERGLKNVCELLLTNMSYAGINNLDKDNRTALHLAIKNGLQDICKLLIPKMSSDAISTVSRYDSGKTALHYAVDKGLYDICQLLIPKMNSDVIDNFKNHFSQMLHQAATSGSKEVCEIIFQLSPEAIKLVTRHYYDNKHYYSNYTALHTAARNGRKEVCELILNKYPDVINAVTEDGKTALHIAAKEGHKEVCETILKLCPGAINLVDKQSCNALHIAARNGYKEVCETILKLCPGAINLVDKQSCTALHIAAEQGHKEVCETILKLSPEAISLVNKQSYTALHIAAQKGYKQVCEFLISQMNQGSINAVASVDNDLNGTALHVAARYGKHEICELLISNMNSEGINAFNKEGKIALYYAVLSGLEAICELLLVRVSPKSLNTVIKDMQTLDCASKSGIKMVCEFLIQKMDSDFIHNSGGSYETTLYHAAKNGWTEICEVLIQKMSYDSLYSFCIKHQLGFESILHLPVVQKIYDSIIPTIDHHACRLEYYTQHTNSDYRPLQYALVKGWKNQCNLILKINPKTVLYPCWGYRSSGACAYYDTSGTGLQAAIDKQDQEMCELMLELNPEASDSYHARYALNTKRTKIAELIISKMSIKNLSEHGPELLHLAAEKGFTDICKFLMSNVPHEAINIWDKRANDGEFDHAVLHFMNRYYHTLHYASEVGNKEVFESILSITPWAINADKIGNTALHYASIAGLTETCEWLISNMGSEAINTVNKSGKTALHFAIKNGMTEICRLLIPKMSLKAINSTGDEKDYIYRFQGTAGTALHVAASEGYKEICEMIIQITPEAINIVDTKNKKTALLLAAEKGHTEVCELLLSRMSQKSIDGSYALGNAAGQGHKEICELLLSRMSQTAIDSCKQYGVTALHAAVERGHKEICELLVSKTSQTAIDALNDAGNTALHIAVDKDLLVICKLLLPKMSPGAINVIRGRKGYNDDHGSALKYAIKQGNLDICKAILEANPSAANVIYKDDCTALQFIIGKQQYGASSKAILEANPKVAIKICKAILKTNPDVAKIVDKKGYTALHLAISEKYIEISEAILGACPSIVTTCSNTNDDSGYPQKVHWNHLDRAFGYGSYGSYDYGSYYVSNSQQILNFAITNKCLKVCEMILKINPSVTFENIKNAVGVGNKEIYELLASNISEDFFNYIDENGDTALNITAAYRRNEISKLLIPKMTHKAINTINKHGTTTLHIAAKNGNTELCRLLISKMDDEIIDAVNSDGYSAYVIATSHGHKEIAELISMRLDHFTGRGVDLYESESYWYEYSNHGMDDILSLRLEKASCEKVNIMPSVLWNGSNAEMLIHKITSYLTKSSTNKSLIPLNLYSKHWVGIIIEQNTYNISITYMDSEQNNIPELLRENLLEAMILAFPQYQIDMIEAELEPQKYNNCGLEVIENFMEYLTGYRLSQDDALSIHSLLYQDSIMLAGDLA